MGNKGSSEKRTSKRSVYNSLTTEEQFHQRPRKKSTFVQVSVSPRPQSQKQNRYEGLEAAQHVSLDSRRDSVSRNSPHRSRAGSLALVKDNKELILNVNAKSKDQDFDDHDLPPPPVPSEEEHEEIMNSLVTLSADDQEFIDYTIVPLLLRSNVDYNSADQFGRILKLKYSSSQLRSFMKTPYGLFAVLQKEGIELSDEVKFDIVEDQFWQQGTNKEEGEGRKRGNSFVYYRDTSSSSVANAAKEKTSSSMQQKTDSRPQLSNKERRRSVKNEFEQQKIKTTEDEKSGFDLKVLRQSLKLLGKEFFDASDADQNKNI